MKWSRTCAWRRGGGRRGETTERRGHELAVLCSKAIWLAHLRGGRGMYSECLRFEIRRVTFRVFSQREFEVVGVALRILRWLRMMIKA